MMMDKGNCQENRPVDQRATQVKRKYKRRAAGLNQTYAPEIVGDGTDGIRGGPWNILHRQRPPLYVVVGAFGEINEDASKLITRNLHASPPRLTLASQCRH